IALGHEALAGARTRLRGGDEGAGDVLDVLKTQALPAERDGVRADSAGWVLDEMDEPGVPAAAAGLDVSAETVDLSQPQSDDVQPLVGVIATGEVLDESLRAAVGGTGIQ